VKAHLKKVEIGLTYKPHDEVHIIANKIGPFNNPTETYRFYSLPFCQEHGEDIMVEPRKGALRHRQHLGQSIVGDRRESSPYSVTFNDNVEFRNLCDVHLSPDELKQFKDAIHNSYFFEMYVEDLPMWGSIGDVVNEDILVGEVAGFSKTYLFPHLIFKFGINNDRIVSATVNTDTDRKIDITQTDKEMTVKFTYSVQFFESDLEWKDRLSTYIDNRFLPGKFEIHWLAVINSFVLVLLLTAFLTIILMRVLKNDFSRYMEIEEDTMEEEESGWKLIHGDVFRTPQYPTLFSAAVGTGTQLLVSTFFTLILALVEVISTTRRGSLLSGFIFIYAFSSFIGGFYSTKLYFQMNGKMWARCVLLTAILFPVPVASVFSWVNTLAFLHGSTSALPFGALVTIIALYLFISLPLTLAGGIFAKNFGEKDMKAPTRTTKVAREIPTELKWFQSRSLEMLISGFLPFSAIYIELHYIFESMWGHRIYTLFGILFCAFVLLIIVTSTITVALLYFQLSRENHQWWWNSFKNGGMIGIFIYIYAYFFYFHKSGMSGVLQSSFYFGYMTIISFAFFLMFGSAGFQLSLVFVKYIYNRVKCD